MHSKSRLNASLLSLVSLCKQKGKSLREENKKGLQLMQPRDTEKWRSLGNEAYNKSVPATSCGQIKGNTEIWIQIQSLPQTYIHNYPGVSLVKH